MEIILQNLPLTKVDDLFYDNLSIDQTIQYTMDGNQISIVVICFFQFAEKKQQPWRSFFQANVW